MTTPEDDRVRQAHALVAKAAGLHRIDGGLPLAMWIGEHLGTVPEHKMRIYASTDDDAAPGVVALVSYDGHATIVSRRRGPRGTSEVGRDGDPKRLDLTLKVRCVWSGLPVTDPEAER